jgi:hypothetical protein
MKNKILLGGLACVSLLAIAVAQSDTNKQQTPAAITVPPAREATSGMAAGKRMHKPMTVTAEVGAREASTGMATGKTAGNADSTKSKASASDDWQAKTAVAPSPKPEVRVAAADVNGDGKADVAAGSSSNGSAHNAAINTSHSNIKNGKDVSTGQSSGKRQYAPATFQKEVGPTSPSK